MRVSKIVSLIVLIGSMAVYFVFQRQTLEPFSYFMSILPKANPVQAQPNSAASKRFFAFLGQLLIFRPSQTVVDLHIPVPNTTPLPVRIYFPSSNDEVILRPVLFWIHPGGFAVGSIAGDFAICTQLASLTGFIVISLEYRLAPQFPFPHAVDDVGELY